MLSTRARKNVSASDIKVDVCIFPFDLLHLNGEVLFQENLKIRREVTLIFARSTVSFYCFFGCDELTEMWKPKKKSSTLY